MKHFFLKYLAISTVLSLGFYFSTGVVDAFSISQSTIEHVIEPGKKVSGSFSVKNEIDAAANFDVVLQGFQPSGETGSLNFFPSNEFFSESSWIVPQEKFFILQPHEVRDFQYTISVPANASAGGHYIAILFSRAAPQELTTIPTIGTGSKNGVSFFIRVTGNIHEEVQVLNFSTDLADSFRHLPVSFETRLQNLGNVHVKPTGSIVIKNFLGRVVTKLPFNADGVSILPNGTRRFLTTWSKKEDSPVEPWNDTLYSSGFISSLKAEFENFAFGRYTAEIQAVYGDSEQRLTSKTTFWVIPWSIIKVVFSLLLLLITASGFYTRFLIGRYIKKLDSR